MIDLLLNSGLLSVTLWVALLTGVAVLASWLRTHAAPRQFPAVPTFVTATLFVAFLAAGTFVNLGYGLYKAYVAPRRAPGRRFGARMSRRSFPVPGPHERPDAPGRD